MTSLTDLTGHLHELLGERKMEDIVLEIKKIDNANHALDIAWSLVPAVSEYLEDDIINDWPEGEASCESVLNELALRCRPKEALMVFLEQMDTFKDDVKFRAFLLPLQTVLMRQPAKRGSSLTWVLSALHAHVDTLPVPKDFNFDDDERACMELDPDVSRIHDVLTALYSFYDPFIQEMSLQLIDSAYKDRTKYQCREISCYLLKLFGHPFTFVDLNVLEGKPKSELRVCAEQYVILVKRLEPNFYSLFDCIQNEAGTLRRREITVLSMATLMYLVHVEGVLCDHLPSVYSHIYIFSLNLPLAQTLLTRTEEFSIHKGLLFLKFLSLRVQTSSLSKSNMNMNIVLKIFLRLEEVAVFCNVQSFRFTSVKLIQELLHRFNDSAKFFLLRELLTSCKHSGMFSVLIHCVKESIISGLESNPASSWFVAPHLEKLLRIIFTLPNGVETDILDNWDRLMTALNLMRFLLQRDTVELNVTGIWSRVDMSAKEFISPLRKALDFSKAHYELELKHLKEGMKSQLEQNVVGVGEGLQLPKLPLEQQQDVLQKAICSFNLMESVFMWVSNILESQG